MASKEKPIGLDWVKQLLKQSDLKKRNSFLALASVGLLALVYLIYSLLFLGQVYPNVTVGGVEYGSLSKQEVRSRLTNQLEEVRPGPVTLIYDGQNHTVSTDEVNWQPKVEETVQAIYGVGRQESFWTSLFQQLLAPFSRQKVQVAADYDSDLLDQKLSTISEGIDRPAKDASARFVSGELVIEREQVGKRINRAEVRNLVINSWGQLMDGQISMQTYFESPKIVVANEEELRRNADALASNKLTLHWEENSKSLTPNEVAQLVGFTGQATESPITDEGEDQKVLTAQFTKEAAKNFIDSFSQTINQPAVDPRLIIKDGQLAVAAPSKTGKVVDVEVSALAVLAALTEPSDTDRNAVLTLRVQEPVVNENNLASLGIKEVIGRGETNFAGSPANRRHNIQTGLSFLQSALLKPGEEFSTVKKLGAVDNTTGYLPELVIKENKTTPEYGGGLCQVSTTLFRSVLAAGLKVTERQNHSYRVSYYEPPVGLDATIYLPRPDFKFLNDTPAHILVQGQIIGNRIIFELWGTSDGRVSNVTEPVISNILPPPPEVRTDTDTLFVGEVKQIEKAHEGATAIAYYTVTRDGKVINKQTFKSVYKPWAAKFLVGTKQPPLPPGP